jgi:hypothetical protein
MSRAKRGSAEARAPEDESVAKASSERRGAVVRRLAPSISASPPALCALRIESFDEATRTVTLLAGDEVGTASLDAALDPAVLRTAKVRGERVIAQREGGAWVVLGALRTAATPGVDEGDEFLIKARRVAVVAAHELSLVTGAASLALRARGHIESIGQDITSRAASVHKIIGRMIRLN